MLNLNQWVICWDTLRQTILSSFHIWKQAKSSATCSNKASISLDICRHAKPTGDWMIQSFRSCCGIELLFLLGGQKFCNVSDVLQPWCFWDRRGGSPNYGLGFFTCNSEKLGSMPHSQINKQWDMRQIAYIIISLLYRWPSIWHVKLYNNNFVVQINQLKCRLLHATSGHVSHIHALYNKENSLESIVPVENEVFVKAPILCFALSTHPVNIWCLWALKFVVVNSVFVCRELNCLQPSRICKGRNSFVIVHQVLLLAFCILVFQVRYWVQKSIIEICIRIFCQRSK